ncbi:MAG: CHAT domain-containing protein [Microcoleaceae cyanobacterium]
MKNWKYFRLIASTVSLLIILPSIAGEQKVTINSKALAQATTNYSQSILQNNPLQNNLKTEPQQLESQATEKVKNGQFKAALEILKRVLDIYNLKRDGDGIGRTLNKIAGVYDEQGKYINALEYYKKSLENAQKDKNSEKTIGSLSKIGLTYSQLGWYEQAIDSYEQTLKENPPDKANITNKIGAIYRRLKDYSKALEYNEKALATYQENQDNIGIAKTLNYIGVTYRKEEKYSEALEYHQQALTIQQEVGDREGEAITLHNIGLLHLESKKYSESLQFLNHSLILERQLKNQDRERINLANIGKVLEKKNQPELAIIFYKQSVNISEAIRKNLKKIAVEKQELEGESVAEIYRNLADLLLQKKRVLEAYQILDLLKVQEIFEYMGTLQINNFTYSKVPLLKPEKVFWKKYTKLIDDARESDSENQNNLQTQLPKIEEFIDSQEVKSIVSELEKNPQSQNLSLDILDIGALLKSELTKNQQKNTVALYPLVLEDRLELILMTANSEPVHRTVPVKRKELNQAIIEFQARLINRNNPQFSSDEKVMQAGLKLYNLLIRPIEEQLKLTEAETIIYAPDGKLRYIPLAALYDGEKWLVEKFEINNITAISLMNFQPSEKFQPVILAGALTEGNYNFQVGQRNFEFEALRFAGVEVEKIEQIFPETNKLLGNAFAKEAMELEMDSYNILHFATHSAFINGEPEESFILFGDGERATLRDVKDWNLKDVELVVLSACQTALGKDLGNGREILGFGYQIQAAGAAATLATLWRVDDQATQEFMNDFYAALSNGESKTKSLREAQLSMINSEFSHPYYWAPFILIGNGF